MRRTRWPVGSATQSEPKPAASAAGGLDRPTISTPLELASIETSWFSWPEPTDGDSPPRVATIALIVAAVTPSATATAMNARRLGRPLVRTVRAAVTVELGSC